MVHRAPTVLHQMLKYLKDELGYDRPQLAILIESNSGVPQAEASGILRSQAAEGSSDHVGEDFIFPLQVSEIRKAYVKRGLLRAEDLAGSEAPERLPIPPDEAGTPQDLPRSFTPASSAALDEMALTQILTTISHRRYQAVGILASNPFDTVFLARRVRRFCPNLRIFTNQADLVFARPQNVTDLRGMLVASTYSLYPANQWISTSYGARPHVLFSNQGAQGLYNAVTAHLWEMGVADHHSGPQLLEFAPPYDAAARAYDPPVWIGAVGERGVFPVRSIPVPAEAGYLYDPHSAPEGPRFRESPNDRDSVRRALEAMRPTAHLLYWLWWLILNMACIAVAALTWVYARWANDAGKTHLDARIGFIRLGGVLRLLNVEVKENGESMTDGGSGGTPSGPSGPDRARPPRSPDDLQERFRDPTRSPCPPRLGAGLYLLLANLLVLAVASYTFSFMLVGLKPFRAGMSWFMVSTYDLTLVSWRWPPPRPSSRRRWRSPMWCSGG